MQVLGLDHKDMLDDGTLFHGDDEGGTVGNGAVQVVPQSVPGLSDELVGSTHSSSGLGHAPSEQLTMAEPYTR